MIEADNEIDSVVDQAVGGDADAVGQLLGRIHPLVVRYCRARLTAGHRGLSTADDVAQEVCMAVLTALPNYRRQGRPFLAFVYTIAGNKVADAHRAGARTRTQPVAEVPELPTTDRDPEALAIDADVSARMADLLDELPGQQREILLLRIAAGLSAEETAQALGMSPGAVRVAQHRGLAKLRRILEGDTGLAEQLI
ncbi:sigma-70 family RNA polymerase sigma factor [Nakamurella silvestris]|nr:sigma-70 family RNA polymerase sigma factor [Nakamurella silvestris]